jgi:hypothetical protein
LRGSGLTAPSSILRTKYATLVDAQEALRHVEVRTAVSDPAWWRIRDRSAPRLEGRYRYCTPEQMAAEELISAWGYHVEPYRPSEWKTPLERDADRFLVEHDHVGVALRRETACDDAPCGATAEDGDVAGEGGGGPRCRTSTTRSTG